MFMEEKKYLLSQINLEILKGRKLYVGNPKEGKYIHGYLPTMKKEDNMSKFIVSEDWVRNFDLIARGVKLSLTQAIELSYDTDALNDFSLVSTDLDSKEYEVYYYIENALFRIGSLWDCFAQYVNIAYDLKQEVSRIHYKSLFNKVSENFEFADIVEHFDEKDDTDENPWKGNFKFYDKLRNSMTHRYSIINPVINIQALEMKDHPTFILKRLCEEYNYICTRFKLEVKKTRITLDTRLKK